MEKAAKLPATMANNVVKSSMSIAEERRSPIFTASASLNCCNESTKSWAMDLFAGRKA